MKKSIITQQAKSAPLIIVMVLMAIVTAFSVSMAWDSLKNRTVVAVTGQVDATPVGTSIKGYWAEAPQGYLLEDGTCKKQADYPSLFSVIGSINFGGTCAGDEFDLPNSGGRVGTAKSTDGTDFDVLGEIGGLKNVTLDSTTMPSHEHGFNGRTISWGTGGGNVHFRETEGSDDYIQAIGGTTNSNNMYTGYWGSTASQGGGGSHNNLQPYNVVRRAIKY